MITFWSLDTKIHAHLKCVYVYGCFIVTRVRVSVLTVLLTLSSKPELSSEPPPHSGLYVSINPRSALYTVPNYTRASM